MLATQARSVQQALLLRDRAEDLVRFEHTYALSRDERARLVSMDAEVMGWPSAFAAFAG